MKLINQVQLSLEDFDKCALYCEADCPLGLLYDFSCALQAFVLQKMKDNEAKQVPAVQSEEPPKE